MDIKAILSDIFQEVSDATGYEIGHRTRPRDGDMVLVPKGDDPNKMQLGFTLGPPHNGNLVPKFYDMPQRDQSARLLRAVMEDASRKEAMAIIDQVKVIERVLDHILNKQAPAIKFVFYHSLFQYIRTQADPYHFKMSLCDAGYNSIAFRVTDATLITFDERDLLIERFETYGPDLIAKGEALGVGMRFLGM